MYPSLIFLLVYSFFCLCFCFIFVFQVYCSHEVCSYTKTALEKRMRKCEKWFSFCLFYNLKNFPKTNCLLKNVLSEKVSVEKQSTRDGVRSKFSGKLQKANRKSLFTEFYPAHMEGVLHATDQRQLTADHRKFPHWPSDPPTGLQPIHRQPTTNPPTHRRALHWPANHWSLTPEPPSGSPLTHWLPTQRPPTK